MRYTRRVPGQSAAPGGARVSPELAGLLWMAFANVLFALMSVFARLSARSASWSTIGASRALIGALVALAFALRTGAPLKTRSRKLSFARSGLGTVSMLLTFYALAQSDLAVGDAATLFATAPLFIALFAPLLLKEPADARLWGLLVIAFAGVACIAGPHLRIDAGPALAALAAAFFSAFAMMILRTMRSGRGGAPPESAAAIALHFALTSAIVHVAITAFNFRVPTAADALFLLLTGLCGGTAQLAMTRAYALAEAARLGAMSYLGTVVAFGLAIAFLGERPEPLQLLGAALVVGSGTMLAVAAARRAATQTPSPTSTSSPSAEGQRSESPAS